MFKKFIHGLIFGAGAAIAFVAVWLVAMTYVIPPALEKMTNKTPDMSGGEVAQVLPAEPSQAHSRDYKLHKGREERRKIPANGGILSIAVYDDDGISERPSTFQAWVTENSAFIISTKEDIPTVKSVPYPSSKEVDYAGTLVHENVGFKEQNMTMHIHESELNQLKSGKQSREDFLNGEYRITNEGVVFFLPDKYEHNHQIQPTQ